VKLNRMNRAGSALLTLGLALAMGCDMGPQPPEPPPDSDVLVDLAPEDRVSLVSGFAWDPEAFFYHSQTCAMWIGGGGPCPIPSLINLGIPQFNGSTLGGAQVMLFDPLAGSPLPRAPAVGDNGGVWKMSGIPARSDVPFFPFTVGAPTLGEASAPPPPGNPPLPPFPPPPTGAYLPTFTMRPVATNYGACHFVEAAQLSNSGVVEAVAKKLTAEGRTMSPEDLITPGKAGGLTVFWLFSPEGEPLGRTPASNVTLEASSGRVFNLDWKSPMGPLTDAERALLSRRGFLVTSASTSPIGLVAVFHEPMPPGPPGPPNNVTYQLVDPSPVNPAQGRPFQYMPVRAPAVPGAVAYGSINVRGWSDPSLPPPPPPPSESFLRFLCLPQ